MAEEKDILKYELDITDVRQKMGELTRLLDQLEKSRATGAKENDPLERQVRSELRAVGDFGVQADRTTLTLENLIRSKRDLGDVVGLLGGQFRGLLGDMTGPIELFMRLGQSAGPIIAVVAAITLAVKGLEAWRDAARKAAEEQERLNKAKAELEKTGISLRTEVAESLRAAGVDPGMTNFTMGRLSQFGGMGARRSIALPAAVAESFMAGIGSPLSPEQQSALLSGVAADPSFSLRGSPQEMRAIILQAIAKGGGGDVKRFAENLFKETASQAASEAPTAKELEAAQTVGNIERAVDLVLQSRGVPLTDKDRERVIRLARGEAQQTVLGGTRLPPRLQPSGFSAPVGELIGLAETAAGIAQSNAGSGGEESGSVILNIGQQYNGFGNSHLNSGFSSINSAPGAGMVSR